MLIFRFAEFIEGSPHLTETEVLHNDHITYYIVCFYQVMEYSHWDYNTDEKEGVEEDIYTDDEEADEAASDDNID